MTAIKNQPPLPRPSDIELIVSDVDGTLLDSSHELPESSPTYNILSRLRRTHPSLPIIISTGKQYSATASLRSRLDLDCFPACHLNGNIIYSPGGEILCRNVLSHDTVRALHDMLRSRRGPAPAFFVYDETTVWQLLGEGRRRDWAATLRAYGEDVRRWTEDGLPRQAVYKMAVCAPEDELAGIREDIRAAFGDGEFSFVQALTFCLEMIPAGGNKGTALERLVKELGIPIEKVVAFGDGGNDASMLRKAGMGVAVGNAMDEARLAAKYNMVETNDEGAVGRFLERVFWPVRN